MFCKGLLIKPLVKHAGTDISHWFNEHSNDVKTYIDPESWRRVPYMPQGRFLHVPPNDPTTDWSFDYEIPWWQNWDYIVGLQTNCSRNIRIMNTLTGISQN